MNKKSYYDKQNIPLKSNYVKDYQDKDRERNKYSYMHTNNQQQELVNESRNKYNCKDSNYIHKTSVNTNKAQSVQQLKELLVKQKQKFKHLQEKTIKEQISVLEQLSLLQGKFKELKSQKQRLELTVEQLKNQYKNSDYQQLLIEHRKVKAIQTALIDMMVKVKGTRINHNQQHNNLHQAWKWIKGVVWQYQAIKTKGLQWKKVYDSVKFNQ